MNRSVHDIAEIVGMLAGRIVDLCKLELLTNGVREGHEWRVGSLANEKGRSMAVHLSGAKAGVWSDFSSGESGDALDLVAQVKFAGNKSDAIQWAKSWLGLDGSNPSRLKESRRKVAAKASEPDTAPDMLNAAFRIWLSASERLRGFPAAKYLEGRGIVLERLGRQPRALRAHPGLYHKASGRKWPALVAAVNDSRGKFVAVHRTWLTANSDLTVSKAPLEDAKMSLGRLGGGTIRLWKGSSGRPLAKALPGETVVISEGIEDGLTIALARPEMRVLCAVSLANMASVTLPDAVTGVVIAADNDAPDSQAAAALERAVAAFHKAGKTVRIARAPGVKDFNDLIRGAG